MDKIHDPSGMGCNNIPILTYKIDRINEGYKDKLLPWRSREILHLTSNSSAPLLQKNMRGCVRIRCSFIQSLGGSRKKKEGGFSAKPRYIRYLPLMGARNGMNVNDKIQFPGEIANEK